jgi:succinate dehydrogenase/fumarate reductase flavoprotein subunit
MIYGSIEHRTWAFLRNEGDFEIDETADSITEVVYRGLSVQPAQDPLSKTVTRLESVADRLESLAASKGQGG